MQAVLVPVDDGGGLLVPAGPDGGVLVPPIFSGSLRVDIGFDYLRPHFDDRAVTLVLPAGAFPVLADTGDLSEEFSLVPRGSVAYDFGDLGLGVSASGTMIQFSGDLQRTLTTPVGTGTLIANSDVSIAVANLIEATRAFTLGEHFCCEGCLGECLVVTTIGARYSYLKQSYDAKLSVNGNTSTLDASEQFSGFGVTGSINLLCPLGADFFLYNTSRGSLLVGRNIKSSTFSVVITDGPGSTSAVASENKTDLIPVGEFEAGLAWGQVLAPAAAPAALETAPLLWLKVGLVAQIWGDLGLLPIADNPHDFSDHNLYLFGFSITAGLER